MQKIVGRTLFVAIWLCFALMLVVGFAVPVTLLLLERLGFDPYPSMLWFEPVQTVVMRCFFPAWVFFVGGCIASFLNVVAWRVPRGKSILGSSHCPNCNVQLKFPSTNMPILGWLKNGGQCAKCQWPIPIRYFVAELVLGIAFVLLFQFQTASGGITVPFRELTTTRIGGLDFQSDLLVMLVYHLSLLSLIFTFAICATEKFAAPLKVIAVGFLILAALQFSSLSPGIVDFRFGLSSRDVAHQGMLSLLDSPRTFLIASVCGLLAAAVCFLVLRSAKSDGLHGSFASLLLVGIAFGWQAVASVMIFSCLVHFVSRIQFTAAIFAGTLLHLLTWRIQLDWPWWPAPNGGLWQLVAGVVWIGVLATVIRLLKPSVCSPIDDQLPSEEMPTSKSLPSTTDDVN